MSITSARTPDAPVEQTGQAAQRVRPGPTAMAISAAAVAVMIAGGFAMLAIVPVALVLIGTLRNVRLRALRWWAAALTALYATALVLWAVGPDRAQSLTKDLHPVLAGLIIASALAVLVRYLIIRRSGARRGR